MIKKVLTNIINFIFLPIRFILSPEMLNKLGLYSLNDERCGMVIKYSQGKLLDIGCGDNQLVKKYGNNGVGVDIYDFGGGGIIVQDVSKLPFLDGSFEVVSFVAVLDYIVNRQEVIVEAKRILSPNGRIIVTTLSPFVANIRHKMAWWVSPSMKSMKQVKMGLSKKYLVSTMNSAGFKLIQRKKFIFWLNCLYIFERHEKTAI